MVSLCPLSCELNWLVVLAVIEYRGDKNLDWNALQENKILGDLLALYRVDSQEVFANYLH